GRKRGPHEGGEPRGGRCGWWALAPACLQPLNTPRGFLLFLCAASFLQGMTVNGFVNTVVTSIERRYDLHSYESGLVASTYDLAACLCLAFVGYFGGRGHKPRWLGWGVLTMGVGSLVFALPHFAVGPYEAEGDAGVSACPANRSAACGRSASGLSGYRLVFMLGQFLHGVGATPLYTLGVTFLDENVKSSCSPVYIATFYTAAILGPAAGYLIGGALLNIYTDIGRRTELTTESPLWVGAWWVGFLGAGAAAILLAVPILGYPRQLPGGCSCPGGAASCPCPRPGPSGTPRSMTEPALRPEAAGSDPGAGSPSAPVSGMRVGAPTTLAPPPRPLRTGAPCARWGGRWPRAPQPPSCPAPTPASASPLGPPCSSTWLLLKNPTFILLCLAGATEATLITGMSTFGPKFLESQFSLSASDAATLFGYLVVPAGGGGTFLGGFFVNRLKLRGSGLVKFCLLCALTSLLATLVFLTHCPNVPMAGVTASYGRRSSSEPVSPPAKWDGRSAHVCEVTLKVAEHRPRAPLSWECSQVYRDCSCVPQNLSSGFGHATAGKCASACQRKPLLQAFTFVVIIFTFLSSVPALTATLRCVREQQRSFALGIQWIVVRTLGGIPGPIAFGWVIDKACLLWQDVCGQHGFCFVYQNAAMSRYLLVAGLVYKVLGCLFFAAACLLYKAPSGPSHGLEPSLPSQSSASDTPADLQAAHSALKLQSDI
ncbi:solute carrier organic anion transporter family member 4A1, partial [Pteropus alecto]|uniref:solute carrier organic anion transporter family member 4A1 n=1 Tax=Pteropus alecto TaxID=9402 RepID=UPI000D538426